MEQKHFWQYKSAGLLLLSLSALGALGLFRVPSSLVSLMLIGIFLLTVSHYLIHWKDPLLKPQLHWGALCLAVLFSLIGFLVFPGNMAYTPAMSSRAEGLHLPYLRFARIVAALQVLIGFYAFYRLGRWMEQGIMHLLSLPEKQPGRFPLFNLLLPLSALGFFAMERQYSLTLLVSALAAAGVVLVVSLHSPSLLSWYQAQKKGLRLLSWLTAAGILIFRMQQADTGLFAGAAAVLAIPFVLLSLLALYSWLQSVFQQQGIFQEISKGEWGFYLTIFLIMALTVSLIFFRTDAFYGTNQEFDVIYTADSPLLVQENAFLSLRHHENDLRQPLFAVFAAPFTGLSWLIGSILPGKEILCPLFMQLSQILMLLTANLLLARMLKLDRKHRMLFLALSSMTYPGMLFLLMMEQYIVAYFWLILCIFLITREKPAAELPLCGTAGTLLTGVILMPALSVHSPIRQFKSWFSQMLGLCLSFLLVILAYGRLDIILNAPTQLLTMLQFSGQKLSFLQKLFQYSDFFRQSLLAPAAGADLVTLGFPSWQLNPADGFSIPGILILLLAGWSLIRFRKDPAVRASGWWLGFSFLVLCLLGWGTQENGLILYSLYFGWAVWIPLFRLLELLEQKLPRLSWLPWTMAVLILSAYNLQGMGSLIRFACSYYPI